jgi:hypothetical protein
MADLVRTVSYLQNALRDGQPDGAIVPQTIRDLVVSVMSAAVGITAAGTTQGTATALTATINIVTTVSSGTGVILPSGIRTVIMHRGANPLLIYPPSGGQLEALGTNVAFLLQPGADATILFDPNNPTHGYVSTVVNTTSMPTTVPSTAGVVWNNNGIISIS